MCLEKAGIEITATEDVVCYKRLKITNSIGRKVPHMSEFKGVVIQDGVRIDCEGKLFNKGGQSYLCTNCKQLSGAEAPNKLGYGFSWMIDTAVQSVIVNGKNVLIKEYITPYREFKVDIGKTYTSLLEKLSGNRVYVGLHSYASLEGLPKCSDDEITVKCLIPKGSVYYQGTFGGRSLNSYASNKLTYLEIVS